MPFESKAYPLAIESAAMWMRWLDALVSPHSQGFWWASASPAVTTLHTSYIAMQLFGRMNNADSSEPILFAFVRTY
ncbi:hypothetical protein HRR99_04535 [Agrobacterium vaccinii]|uniref:hypothetical protein n=1 Tax=Agrobacterium vaccinii TaxID=2735528 RepID=UPI001E4ED43A|nr:hypothetical protein [Agrobacterium vaccinii]UHS60830.1 hypothetical protein HRR99_04535 [Agrobacterium vaccinii]